MFYNYVSRQKCSKARVNNKIVAIGIQHIAIQSLLFSTWHQWDNAT